MEVVTNIDYKEYLRLSCIYSYVNKIDGKRYIGQTRDLYGRLHQHKSSCGCVKLRRAFENHGYENFEIEIIERCSIEELNAKEEYWIAFYNSTVTGYNVLKGYKDFPEKFRDVMKISHAMWPDGRFGKDHWGYGIPRSEEVKKKISDAQKGRPSKYRKPVICFDEKMNPVKEYTHIKAAAEELGCKTCNIQKACQHKLQLMTAGFYWRYKEDVLPLLV